MSDINKQIWEFLKSKGLTDYACAGVEGNLYCESGCRSNNLQNTYEKSLGMSDEEYTRKVDSGEYTNFVNDSAGYGLAQWTYWSRKEKLLNYAHSKNVGIEDLQMQLEYLWMELSSNNALLVVLNGAQSVYEASTIFMCRFENPANQSDLAKQGRANIAQRFYNEYAGGSAPVEYKYLEVLNGIATYSKRDVGECFFTIDGRVSNFQVKEFACHDQLIVAGGTNEIKIDGDLVRKLQMCRDKFGVTVITSAYRTEDWNRHEGGVPKSQHCEGRASDTICRNVSPLELAMYAEAIGMGGVGLYDNFTHIDTRPDKKARWKNNKETGNREVGVQTFLKTIKLGSRGNEVRIAQKYLGVAVDGVFWTSTRKATLEFQRLHRLDDDGIIGLQTWTKLLTQ